MTEIQAGNIQLIQVAGRLAVPLKIGAELPEAVLSQLALLPVAQQREFLNAYQMQSHSLLLAYLASLIYCHYGLLGRWAMTGMMFLTLFVAVALGWVVADRYGPDAQDGAGAQSAGCGGDPASA